jgi:hypothetical protein
MTTAPTPLILRACGVHHRPRNRLGHLGAVLGGQIPQSGVAWDEKRRAPDLPAADRLGPAWLYLASVVAGCGIGALYVYTNLS